MFENKIIHNTSVRQHANKQNSVTCNTSFAVKLVLKTKRVKRRMVSVIDQDVHADLCHCDVCLARQRNFRDKYSPAKISDNHAYVKKIAAVTYKLKQKICQIRRTICVAVTGRGF